MGQPVPFAKLSVSLACSVDYAPVADGTQNLTLRTNHLGEVDLPRLPYERVAVSVTFGSRNKEVELDPGRSFALVRLPAAQ